MKEIMITLMGALIAVGFIVFTIIIIIVIAVVKRINLKGILKSYYYLSMHEECMIYDSCKILIGVHEMHGQMHPN